MPGAAFPNDEKGKASAVGPDEPLQRPNGGMLAAQQRAIAELRVEAEKTGTQCDRGSEQHDCSRRRCAER